MASFSQMKALQEERNALLAIASELNTQLQRLKIEELALLSMMTLQEEKNQASMNEGANVTSDLQVAEARDEDDGETETLEELDLTVTNTKGMEFEEEEEEDESEEEIDQLTIFMNDLVHRTGKGTS